jgi:hypothetical protein
MSELDRPFRLLDSYLLNEFTLEVREKKIDPNYKNEW